MEEVNVYAETHALGKKTLLKTKKRPFRFLPSKRDIPFLVLLIPSFLTVLLFMYLPFIGLVMAFREASFLEVAREGIFAGKWVGLDVFKRVFDMPDFGKAVGNTLMLSGLTLIFSFPLPIVFSLLLDEFKGKHFKPVVQTISYLPHFLSWVAITGMVLNMVGQDGLIYNIFGENITFKENTFIPVYIFLIVWQNLGWGSILYTSALAGISPDLYEAASIDGAGRFKQVIVISLPELVPVIMIQLILQLGNIFNSNFDLVWNLNSGLWNMDVLSTLLYRKGWQEYDYSFSTAVSILNGGVALLLTLGANWLSKKLSNVSMF